MDVSSVEQAIIAEQSGACAVMALERIPADIRKEGRSQSSEMIHRFQAEFLECLILV